MSEKYENFILALKDLCASHKVCLSTSAYDFIEVHDIGNDGCTIHQDRIEDCTKGDSNVAASKTLGALKGYRI